MKQGEEEAKLILESMGIEFDDSYYDDNSSESMPDLRYKDGRYLEVTHTQHNADPLINPQNYCSESIEEELKKQTKISEALQRVLHMDYKRDDKFKLTDSAHILWKKDLAIVKKGLGYDPTQMDMRKQHSEFKCSNPSFLFDLENIIEVIDKKASKHFKNDTDLFIFAQEDEFSYMLEVTNIVESALHRHIVDSPFNRVYICKWDFFHQKYVVDKPSIVCFSKKTDERLVVDDISLVLLKGSGANCS